MSLKDAARQRRTANNNRLSLSRSVSEEYKARKQGARRFTDAAIAKEREEERADRRRSEALYEIYRSIDPLAIGHTSEERAQAFKNQTALIQMNEWRDSVREKITETEEFIRSDTVDQMLSGAARNADRVRAEFYSKYEPLSFADKIKAADGLDEEQAKNLRAYALREASVEDIERALFDLDRIGRRLEDDELEKEIERRNGAEYYGESDRKREDVIEEIRNEFGDDTADTLREYIDKEMTSSGSAYIMGEGLRSVVGDSYYQKILDSISYNDTDELEYWREKKLEELKVKKWNYENILKYNFLSENDDFEELSGEVKDDITAKFGIQLGDAWFGIGDPRYDYINDIDGTQQKALYQSMMYGGSPYYAYSFMTDEEIDIYNYLYNSEGKESADEYADYLKISLDERKIQKLAGDYEDFATESPVLMSALSVPMSLLGGLGGINVAWQNLVKGVKEGVTGEYAGPVNYNGDMSIPSVMSSVTRETVAQNIADATGVVNLDEEEHPVLSKIFNGKNLGDLYQLGMSLADSGAAASLAPFIGTTASTALLAGNAGTQGVLSAVEKGATDEQALLMGVLNGAFEFIFEKYEIEQLFGSNQNILKTALNQSFTETFGEGATTLANTAADILVMAEKSNLSTAIDDYMTSGLSKTEATKRALLDAAIQIGWDAVGGTISGSVMGAGHSAIQSVTDRINLGKTFNPKNAAPADIDAQVATLTGYVELFGEDSKNGRKAQDLINKIESGSKIKSREIASLAMAAASLKKRQGDSHAIQTVIQDHTANRFVSKVTTKSAETSNDLNTLLTAASGKGQSADTAAKRILANEMMTGDVRGLSGLDLYGSEAENAEAVKKFARSYVTGSAGQSKRTVGIAPGDIGEITAVNKDGEVIVSTPDGEVAASTLILPEETARLYDIAGRYDTQAARIFVENFTDKPADMPVNIPLATYANAFRILNALGRQGVGEARALREASVFAAFLGEHTARMAYRAGYAYSARSRAEAGLPAVTRKGEGKVTGEARNESVGSVSEAIAKALGVDIEYSDNLESGARFIASIGKFVISESARDQFSSLMHEVGEFADVFNQKEAVIVRDAVLGWYAEKNGADSLDKLVSNYQKLYAEKEGAKTYDSAKTELFNDALAALFASEEGAIQFGDWLDANVSEAKKKTIIDKIVEFLDKIISALRNLAATSELTETQQKFAEMEAERAIDLRDSFLKVLSGAVENYNAAEVTETTSNGPETIDARHSIEVDNYGDPVVVINTDQGLFNGVNESEYKKIAGDYMKKHFKNAHLPLSNYGLTVITKIGINKYLYANKNYDSKMFKAKTKAALELDNLLSIAEYDGFTIDKKDHSFASDGFEHYKTNFIVDGQVFEGIIDIGYSGKGATFYGISNMKRATPMTARYSNLLLDTISPSFRRDNSNSDNSVPQGTDIVNNQYTQNSENDVRNQIEIDDVLTEKGREQAKDLGIDLADINWNALDNYNETRYNDTGWAVVNGIVSNTNIQNFRDRLAEMWQMSHDKRINTVYVPQDGIYYYFVGGFKKPSIKAIYVIDPSLREQIGRDDYPIMERMINTNGRKEQFARADAFIRSWLGERLVDSYDRRDRPGFRQLFQYRNYGELDTREFDTRYAGQRGSANYKERSVNDNEIFEDEEESSSFSVRNQVEIEDGTDMSLGSDEELKQTQTDFLKVLSGAVENYNAVEVSEAAETESRNQTEIDNLTEKEYNNFGWVRANDVLTSAEYQNLTSDIAKRKTGAIFPYKDGWYIVEVDNGDDTKPNTAFAFTNGEMDDLVIDEVVRVYVEDQNEFDIIKEILTNAENTFSSSGIRFGEGSGRTGLFERFVRSTFSNSDNIPKLERIKTVRKKIYIVNSPWSAGRGTVSYIDGRGRQGSRFYESEGELDEIIAEFNTAITQEQMREILKHGKDYAYEITSELYPGTELNRLTRRQAKVVIKNLDQGRGSGSAEKSRRILGKSDGRGSQNRGGKRTPTEELTPDSQIAEDEDNTSVQNQQEDRSNGREIPTDSGGMEGSQTDRNNNLLRKQSNDSGTVSRVMGSRKGYAAKIQPYPGRSEGWVGEYRNDSPGSRDRLQGLLRTLSSVRLTGEDTKGRRITTELTEALENTVFKTEDGKLIPLYHGTTAEFDDFKIGQFGFHFGTYEQAENRTETLIRNNTTNGKTKVYKERFLNVTNPLICRMDLMSWRAFNIGYEANALGIISDQELDELSKLSGFSDTAYDSEANVALRDLLKSKGYDAVIYPNDYEGNGASVIIFENSQIFNIEEPTKKDSRIAEDEDNSPSFSVRNQIEIDDNGNYIIPEQDAPYEMLYSQAMNNTEIKTLYGEAKNGNVKSAAVLLDKVLKNGSLINHLKENYQGCLLLPVTAMEGMSDNVLPITIAKYLFKKTGLEVYKGIYKTSVNHMKQKSAEDRAKEQITFDTASDKVYNGIQGKEFVIIDDTYATGTTSAALADYIKNAGGTVRAAASLFRGHDTDFNTAITQEQMREILKHGKDYAYEITSELYPGTELNRLTRRQAKVVIKNLDQGRGSGSAEKSRRILGKSDGRGSQNRGGKRTPTEELTPDSLIVKDEDNSPSFSIAKESAPSSPAPLSESEHARKEHIKKALLDDILNYTLRKRRKAQEALLVSTRVLSKYDSDLKPGVLALTVSKAYEMQAKGADTADIEALIDSAAEEAVLYDTAKPGESKTPETASGKGNTPSSSFEQDTVYDDAISELSSKKREEFMQIRTFLIGELAKIDPEQKLFTVKALETAALLRKTYNNRMRKTDIANGICDMFTLKALGADNDILEALATEVSLYAVRAKVLDKSATNLYNMYINGRINEYIRNTIIRISPYSALMTGYFRTLAEVEIYSSIIGLTEDTVNGNACLIRPEGIADYSFIDLHHVGQEFESPFAELTAKEHRKYSVFLHDYRKSSWRNIDGANGKYNNRKKDHRKTRKLNYENSKGEKL